MLKIKVGLSLLLLFVLVRYAVVYHRATEFSHYLQDEVALASSNGSLKKDILLKAEQTQLPIREENISISTNGPELRVSVEYQIPLDLVLFQKPLTFHTTGVHIN